METREETNLTLFYIYLRLEKVLKDFYKISFKLRSYKKLVFLSYVEDILIFSTLLCETTG